MSAEIEVPDWLVEIGETCVRAVHQRENIRFTYRGRQRYMSPHMVALRKKVMCIGQTWDPETGTGGWRCFYLHRMEDLEVLDENVWFTSPDYNPSSEPVIVAAIGVDDTWARHVFPVPEAGRE